MIKMKTEKKIFFSHTGNTLPAKQYREKGESKKKNGNFEVPEICLG